MEVRPLIVDSPLIDVRPLTWRRPLMDVSPLIVERPLTPSRYVWRPPTNPASPASAPVQPAAQSPRETASAVWMRRAMTLQKPDPTRLPRRKTRVVRVACAMARAASAPVHKAPDSWGGPQRRCESHPWRPAPLPRAQHLLPGRDNKCAGRALRAAPRAEGRDTFRPTCSRPRSRCVASALRR